ncbi:MAG: OmpA family protein [Candidatus Zixiibacteriota bacterium]|nr:MAG: OmpA family protein [candidate division Zixibacteria bacterium]
MLVALLLLPLPATAQDNQSFSFGAGLGGVTLGGGKPPRFTAGPAYHLNFAVHFSQRWRAEMGFYGYKLYDDLNAESSLQIGSDKKDRTRGRKAYDLSFLVKLRLFSPADNLGVVGGLGGGVSIWEITDPQSDRILLTSGAWGEPLELTATEIMLSSALALEYAFSEKWIAAITFDADYLTGAGLEFANTIEDSLSRWGLRAGLSLAYAFGGGRKISDWDRREAAWSKAGESSAKPTPKISSPPPKTGKAGKSKTDKDGDGVPDGLDACPNTDRKAYGFVDVYGCPVDSDFDGIPDYNDDCPDNQIGATVDENGCPRDSDSDGVPDGIDDCPNSESGFAVDKYGCLDLSVLEKRMILHIKYDPGSFEIDRASKGKLKDLATILRKAYGVRVEILGFTDNIGLPEDNRNLSQKRANRVRDYLVSLGIESNRLTPVGKGEINFIASNATREGRQKNRRVELIFLK